LRTLARENHRPVDELLQLYVLEAFLARLTNSRFTEQFVLKGGVLLAAFDERDLPATSTCKPKRSRITPRRSARRRARSRSSGEEPDLAGCCFRRQAS
jgi:hypothetical protein